MHVVSSDYVLFRRANTRVFHIVVFSVFEDLLFNHILVQDLVIELKRLLVN